MILCDLCGKAKECLLKEIDGREYDVCAECWRPLAEKLHGKGRKPAKRVHVFLPPLTTEPERQEPKPPAEPPKIWGDASRPQ